MNTDPPPTIPGFGSTSAGTIPGVPSGSGSPPTILIILAIIALIALVIAWTIFKGFLRTMADQHIFYRQNHRDGRRLVAERFQFAVRAPQSHVTETIVAALKVGPGIPTAVPEVYLKEAAADKLVIGYGSSLLRKNFEATIALNATGDATIGTWQITAWTTTNGVVDCVPVIRRLRADLETAMRTLIPAGQ